MKQIELLVVMSFAILALCANLPGIYAQDNPESAKKTPGSDKAAGASQTLRDDRIYIESVPVGATVTSLPEETGKGDEVVLGKTPLVLDPARIPTMRFAITMNAAEYAKAIKGIPGLESWTIRFQKQSSFRKTSNYGQDDFDFGDAENELITMDATGEITTVGPIYHLNWPKHHRVVALFIPKDVKPSVFFPLMPARGTFAFTDPQRVAVKNNFDRLGFSEEQSAEALDVLSRCGKYMTRLKPGDGRGKLAIISFQKGSMVILQRGVELPLN